jgi:transposase
MEACTSAHWFARELTVLGHTARIIAPEFVRAFRLSGKNAANDAAAICAAVRQPQLRFVTVKSAEQQARLVVHRLRQGWQEERTAGLNRVRGLLAEFGRVYANSAAAILSGARAVLPDETLPAALRHGVARQLDHLRELDAHLADCDGEIAQQAHEDPRAQCLARLSGVGVLTASAVAATVSDAQQFRCGRQFAAWMGSPRGSTPPAASRAWGVSLAAATPSCGDSSCNGHAQRCKPPCASPRHAAPASPHGSSPPMNASAITKPW